MATGERAQNATGKRPDQPDDVGSSHTSPLFPIAALCSRRNPVSGATFST
jgi:hypothetical protein